MARGPAPSQLIYNPPTAGMTCPDGKRRMDQRPTEAETGLSMRRP